MRALHPIVLCLSSFSIVPAVAQALTPEELVSAIYDGGDLPEDQSALTAKVQILLDRSGISPGVIDGHKGGMSESALRAFETQQGFQVDGILDGEVWAALGGSSAAPVLQKYSITVEDLSKVVATELPDDYAELAKMELLGYERASEALAEQFHMDEDFLIQLNPDASFGEGERIWVVDPGAPVGGKIVRIEVLKQTNRLAAFDEAGQMLVNYPVTIGSDATPSGTIEVKAIAPDPTYSYNPEVNFQQGDNTEFLELPPGPNGPVGSMWIDLSEPTYGLHGTPEPSQLFKRPSHGCVRLTNWDAEELAGMVGEGTVVEFRE